MQWLSMWSAIRMTAGCWYIAGLSEDKRVGCRKSSNPFNVLTWSIDFAYSSLRRLSRDTSELRLLRNSTETLRWDPSSGTVAISCILSANSGSMSCNWLKGESGKIGPVSRKYVLLPGTFHCFVYISNANSTSRCIQAKSSLSAVNTSCGEIVIEAKSHLW